MQVSWGEVNTGAANPHCLARTYSEDRGAA